VTQVHRRPESYVVAPRRSAGPAEGAAPALLHEYGHLAGYRDPANPLDPHHSRDPRSIMWPFAHADARCARRGGPYLGLSRH
jgi:hypothetical protein